MIYKTLVLTGLRKNELATLTVGQLELDGPAAFAQLHAADEKNRQGNQIALRADLVADLKEWLAASKLSPDSLLFRVPAGLIRILDRDLVAAGLARRVRVEESRVRIEAKRAKGGRTQVKIAGKWRTADGKLVKVDGDQAVIAAHWVIDKRDERGRTLDVHALRHSFSTLLSVGGVAPRTAQAAMRHSDIKLTMQTYTDPKLLDVHGAIKALPSLPLRQGDPAEFAPGFAPAAEYLGNPQITPDNTGRMGGQAFADAVADPANAKGLSQSTCDKPLVEREKGIEPSTVALGRQYSTTELLPQ